jgi:OOP family OmpA-OmpF porin
VTLPADPEEGGPDQLPETNDADAYHELRRLLFGREQERLDRLRRRLDDLDARSDDVAEVLPEAILKETRRGDRLSAALAPTVEEALQVSIRRNPRPLVEAISPIMGPAIRRSILQAISGMVQSLNEAMEHSLSPQGLRWRVEAWRTGKSFGEVVALNTLLFQVEQVFLIHKETGLLLRHQSVRRSTDPDLVGSMLVAIRDFVKDSFGEDGGGGTLDTVHVGDRTVWVEGGRDAVLATVVQGRAPESLRDTLTESLEQIEMAHGEALRAYDGDDSGFEDVDPILGECLVSQQRAAPEGRKRRSPVTLLAWSAAGLVLLAWATLSIRDARRWSRYVTALDAQPGILVTGTDREDGRRVVRGLRDRFAADPFSFLAASSMDSTDVRIALEPYASLDPEMVVHRATAALQPPPGVEFRVDGDRLVAVGAPGAAWLARARDLAPLVAGVGGLDVEGEPAEVLALDGVAAELRTLVIRFPTGRAVVAAGPALDLMRAHLAKADSLARTLRRPVQVTATGSADAATGSADLNQSLAQRRAEALLAALPASAYPGLVFLTRPQVVAEPGVTPEESAARSVRLILDPRE